MNSKFGRLVVSFLFLSMSFLTYAQNWNLVWREDFGVAEDTVIKNFADQTNSVPGHCFMEHERFCNGSIQWDAAANANVCVGFYDCRPITTGLAQCGTINDGFYGITNNTHWAYNRWQSCGVNAGHFIAGRDHTGNKNGAMLVINSGVGEGDAIYSKKIEFNLCDSREYRFVIYVASITTYGNDDPSDPSGGNANLEMRVVNANTGNVVQTIQTGAIPYWIADGWGDTNNGIADLNGERTWSEYSCEFTANDGDVLELQVTNWGSGYNDFAIDDISLYRKDTEEVPDPLISSNTIASSSTIVDGCIFMASFTVPDDVLPAWKKIYDNVYFLWQKSEDDGLSWQNVLDVSGVEKTSVEIEVDKEVPTVYRVIITGGSTAAIAEEQALYIAANGAPKDGCAYYSISNTLAGVSPTPDCSYSEDARVVWKEDFGIIDSFSTRSHDACLLDYYSPTVDGFAKGNYVVTSAPDSSIKKIEQDWSGKFLNYSYKEKSLADASGSVGGAMLYTYFGKKSTVETENILFEKVIDGPFCKCKSYNFSFQFYDFNEWAGENLQAVILDESDNILGSSDITINNSNSRRWVRSVTPFELPLTYTGAVKVRILNATPSNDWNYVCFDDFQISVCGESAPKASIQIDNDPTLSYLTGFSCEEEPLHKVSILDDAGWKSLYPDYGFAWQYSLDGVTWNYLSSDVEVEHEGESEILVSYRLVVAEEQSAAIEIAKTGKATDPCVVYGFSNIVALMCKDQGCKAPVFEMDMVDDTMHICSDLTQNITLIAKQTNKSNVDAMQWYSSPADMNVWSAIQGATTETLEVLPTDSTDYLFIAQNDTCFSDSIFARINVHKAISFETFKDTVLCEGASWSIIPVLISGNPTEYNWQGVASVNPNFDFVDVSANNSGIITFSASDGVCISPDYSLTLSVENRYNVTWPNKQFSICEGNEVPLVYTFGSDADSAAFDALYQTEWYVNEVFYSNKISEVFTPSEDAVIKHVVSSSVCGDTTFLFDVSVAKIPQLSLTANVDSLCAGEELTLSASYVDVSQVEWKEVVDGVESVLSTDLLAESKIAVQKSASYYLLTPADVCPAVSSDTIEVFVDEPMNFTFSQVANKVCAGDIVSLAAQSTGGSFQSVSWSKNGTQVSQNLDFQDTPSELTVYDFVAQSALCPSVTESFVVDVVLMPTISLASNEDSLCAGEELTLSATYANVSQVEWKEVVDGVESVLSTDLLAENKIAVQKSASYYLLTPADVCPAVSSDTIEVFVDEPMNFTFSQVANKVCAGDIVSLAAQSTGGSFQSVSWSKNGTQVSQNLDFQDAPSELTVYDFVAQSALCPSVTNSITVDVEVASELSVTAVKSSVCQGDEILLSATFGSSPTIEWQYSVDNISFQSFSSDLMTEKSFSQLDTYHESYFFRLQAQGSGLCPVVYSKTIEVKVEPTLNWVWRENPTICKGDTLHFDLPLTVEQQALYSFSWSDDSGVLSSDMNFHSAEILENTNFSLLISSQVCPPVSHTYEVVVQEPVVLTISSDKNAICAGETLLLTADYTSATSLTWFEMKENETLGSQFASDLVASQSVNPLKSTSYWLEYPGDNVCPEPVKSNVISVIVEEPSTAILEGAPQSVCYGSDVKIKATKISGESTEAEWLINGVVAPSLTGELVDVPTVDPTIYQYVTKGTYCKNDTQSVSVAVERNAKLILAAAETEFCQGDEFTLTADFGVASRLNWEQSSNGIDFTPFSSELVPSLSLIADKSASYRLSTAGTGVCPTVYSNVVSVNVEQKVSLSLPDDKLICPSDEFLLNAQTMGTPAAWIWEEKVGNAQYVLSSLNGFTHTLKPTETVSYKLTAKMNVCEDVSDEITISVDSIPTLNLLASTMEICEGEIVNLSTDFEYGSSLIWEEFDMGIYQTISTASLGLAVTPDKTTTYRLSATTMAGCEVPKQEVTITVHEAIEASVDDVSICQGDQAKLVLNGKGNYQYAWSETEDFSAPIGTDYQLVVSPTETTLYNLQVKNGLCEALFNPLVTVTSAPKIISAEDIGNKSFLLVTEGGTSPLMFDFGDGREPSMSDILDRVVYGKSYQITVTDALGCNSSFLLETPSYDIVIPEIFNPDEGVWDVENLDKFGGTRVTIFDRTGRVIIEMDGADFEGWDGTYNGNPMPSTDYWYVINVDELNVQYVGHFTLIRN